MNSQEENQMVTDEEYERAKRAQRILEDLIRKVVREELHRAAQIARSEANAAKGLMAT